MSFEWGCPKWGGGLQGRRAAPGTRARVVLGSCPRPGSGLNQLGPREMELPGPWHQTLIRRDPMPGEASEERAAGKVQIQFELARRLPAWETPEERTFLKLVAGRPRAVPVSQRGAS